MMISDAVEGSVSSISQFGSAVDVSFLFCKRGNICLAYFCTLFILLSAPDYYDSLLLFCKRGDLTPHLASANIIALVHEDGSWAIFIIHMFV